jgi:hypothetical protein
MRKILAKREIAELDSLSIDFMYDVERALARIRKSQVTLYLRQNDRYKLLRIRVWISRYHVTLEYILSRLLPFWEQFVQRRSKKMKKEGLNVRVGTLTGKKSESILLDMLKKDYPNNLQKAIFIASERTRIFNLLEKQYNKDFKIKEKSMIDYSSPKRYVNAYRRRMIHTQRQRENFTEEMKLRPYRNNPFCPERV